MNPTVFKTITLESDKTTITKHDFELYVEFNLVTFEDDTKITTIYDGKNYHGYINGKWTLPCASFEEADFWIKAICKQPQNS